MTPNTLEPLDGEAVIPGVTNARPANANLRRVLAIAVLAISVIGIVGYTVVRRFISPGAEAAEKPAPEVASADARKLDMPQPPKINNNAPRAPSPAALPSTSGTRVGEIDPDVAPIPLRGSSAQGGTQTTKPIDPDDAPMFAAGAMPASRAFDGTQASTTAPDVKASAALENYQKQAAPLLAQLQRLTNGNAGIAASPMSGAPGAPGTQGGTAPPAANPPPLFGTFERSATPTVNARLMGDRSLVVPKGTLFTCSLKTRVITATSGFVGCQVIRNVFSDDGKVLLVERGSHLDGEYRVVQVRPGLTRVPVLWTRVRTPTGVSVDLDSPATGALGESGIDGYVDNRWAERIGGALLLSLVDDAVKFALASQDSGNNGSNNTVLLPNTTAQGSKLAEKVLEATINIPPLLYKNQGGVVGVYVARDLDFSSVYELRPQ
jgi:type IV secretion system protein VirB10